MEEISRIEGLVNQRLLQELGTTLTSISEDLWEEGFDSGEIMEYIQKFVGDALVDTMYGLEKSETI